MREKLPSINPKASQRGRSESNEILFVPPRIFNQSLKWLSSLSLSTRNGSSQLCLINGSTIARAFVSIPFYFDRKERDLARVIKQSRPTGTGTEKLSCKGIFRLVTHLLTVLDSPTVREYLWLRKFMTTDDCLDTIRESGTEKILLRNSKRRNLHFRLGTLPHRLVDFIKFYLLQRR
jgi:hypothetical protein